MRTACLIGLLFAARLAAAADPAALAGELRRLDAELAQGKEAAVRAALPAAWEVNTSNGTYRISTAPLRDLLEKRPGEAKEWLAFLATQLEGYSAASRIPANARARLDRILSRREFAGIGPPSAWELLRERVAAWIARLLQRLFDLLGVDAESGVFFFWVLLAAAVGALGFLLLRWWMRGERTEAFIPGGQATHLRGAPDWMRSAREAAARNDWRTAVHCAYWAGVVSLEETGALPFNRTRTPREALRALARSPLAAPLKELTARLERFWYARAAAGAEDFAACLESLEALGCRVR
jgi:hypothetical protein